MEIKKIAVKEIFDVHPSGMAFFYLVFGQNQKVPICRDVGVAVIIVQSNTSSAVHSLSLLPWRRVEASVSASAHGDVSSCSFMDSRQIVVL